MTWVPVKDSWGSLILIQRAVEIDRFIRHDTIFLGNDTCELTALDSAGASHCRLLSKNPHRVWTEENQEEPGKCERFFHSFAPVNTISVAAAFESLHSPVRLSRQLAEHVFRAIAVLGVIEALVL